MKVRVLCLLCLVSVIATCSMLVAQTSTGSITGNVTDQSGAAVPGAHIKITSELTGTSRETVSDPTGLYQALFLPVGRYSITVSAPGFQETTQTGIGLDVQQALRFDIALKVAAQQEAITVSAHASLLNVENSTVGDVITNERVIDLPLNGRNFNQLSLLTPGVIEFGGGGNPIGFGGQLGIDSQHQWFALGSGGLPARRHESL